MPRNIIPLVNDARSRHIVPLAKCKQHAGLIDQQTQFASQPYAGRNSWRFSLLIP